MNFTLLQKVKVIEKKGALRQLGELMREGGFHHAFLVCDGGIAKMGLAEKIRTILEKEGFACTLYDKVQPDPPSTVVDEGAALCREAGCDCVIAVGGGSSIDTAKGINILRFNEGRILDYADPTKAMHPTKGLIAIPTTSGTGSELSNGLIVSDVEKGVKAPILAVEGMSEYAILDPELTIGMPAGLTLITGLDVFSHACESYTSILSTTPTDMLCEKIHRRCRAHYLPRAVSQRQRHHRPRTHAFRRQAPRRLGCLPAPRPMSDTPLLTFSEPPSICLTARPAPSVCLRLWNSSLPVVPEKVKKIGLLLGADFTGNETPAEIGQKAAEASQEFPQPVQPYFPRCGQAR